MDYGLIGIFITGLATSLHCISMCGSLVLSYSLTAKGEVSRKAAFFQNLSYNGAKLLSYTAVGLAAGLLGSIFNLAGLSVYISFFAGAFMLLLGLNMLGVFPWVERLIPKLPSGIQKGFLKSIGKANKEGKTRRAPILFGLMSGLMPCGPLQAMVLYAAGTGNILKGGATMIAFGLGTVPLMLAFGTFASILSATLKKRLARVSAVIVIILGLVMINRGLLLTGSDYNLNRVYDSVARTLGIGTASTTAASTSSSVQEVKIDVAGGYQPNSIDVTVGKPVRLTFERHESNACSKEVVFPDLGIRKTLPDDGTAVVEFTPNKEGALTFTCQMGMLYGTVNVLPAGGTTGQGGGSALPTLLMLGVGAPMLYGAYLVFRRGRIVAVEAKVSEAGRKSGKGERSGSKTVAPAGGLRLPRKTFYAAIAVAIVTLIAAVGAIAGTFKAGEAVSGGSGSSASSSTQGQAGIASGAASSASSGCCGSGGGGCGGGPANDVVSEGKAKLSGNAQTIDVKVEGGYAPNVIKAKAGVPLTLNFIRGQGSGCDEYLVMPDFKVNVQLPTNGKMPVTITPKVPGEYSFTCGMGMLSGKLVVE